MSLAGKAEELVEKSRVEQDGRAVELKLRGALVYAVLDLAAAVREHTAAEREERRVDRAVRPVVRSRGW